MQDQIRGTLPLFPTQGDSAVIVRHFLRPAMAQITNGIDQKHERRELSRRPGGFALPCLAMLPRRRLFTRRQVRQPVALRAWVPSDGPDRLASDRRLGPANREASTLRLRGLKQSIRRRHMRGTAEFSGATAASCIVSSGSARSPLLELLHRLGSRHQLISQARSGAIAGRPLADLLVALPRPLA